MTRYFFNLRLGDTQVMDREGTVCADAAAARREAFLVATDFVDRPSGEVAAKWRDWEMDVEDEGGCSILRQPLKALVTADALRAHCQCSAHVSAAVEGGDVVYLGTVRLGRRHRALANQRRAALRRMAELTSRQSASCNGLYSAIEAARALAGRAQAIVGRARAQASIEQWGGAKTAASDR